jgi:hypothetical protein
VAGTAVGAAAKQQPDSRAAAESTGSSWLSSSDFSSLTACGSTQQGAFDVKPGAALQRSKPERCLFGDIQACASAMSCSSPASMLAALLLPYPLVGSAADGLC